MLQVLSGLAYLETLHIAHRDIRSDNLLLSRTGILKLGGFPTPSICMLKADTYPQADFSQAIVTQPGMMLLSVVPVPPYWMAPEMRL